MSGTLAVISGRVGALHDIFLGSAAPLLLGDVEFASWEVPERITYGTGQSLAVHTLPGGSRVIDAMGRNDADIDWSGTFLGPDAEDRAEDLRTMASEGQLQPLSWGSLLFDVVVSDFHAERTFGRVNYRIVCKVLTDRSSEVQKPQSLLSSVLQDINDVVGFDVVGTAQTALTQAQSVAAGITVLTGGSPAAVNMLGTLTSVQGDLSLGLGTAGQALDLGAAAAGTAGNLLGATDPIAGAASLNSAAADTGTAANYSGALGFTNRAVANLAGATP